MRSRKIAAALFFAIFGLGNASQATAAPKDSMLATLDQSRYTQELTGTTGTERSDALCLALNLYHEARGSTQSDITGVAWVTRNRVESPAARGRNYCQIIWERGQYSWTTRSVTSLLPREMASWDRMVRISLSVMKGEVSDPTNGCNTFYATRLGTPSWTRRGTGRVTIGAHTYVRLPGR